MLLVLDSATLYYRAFHSLPESMTAPDGFPHNAVRGFLSTVGRLVKQHSADEVIAAWDADWRPQWRVDLLPSYKAHRVAEPDEPGSASGGATETTEATEPETLGPQVSAIASVLEASGVAVVGAPGFEADDVVATVAHQRPCIAVSGDRDLVQVVSSSVQLHLAVNGGMEKWPLLDPAGVHERFGVRPDQYVDLSVLRGDPSDGLPGVAGVGPKTAVALLSAFDTIEGVLRAADSAAAKPMTPRLAGLLLEAKDYLARARPVATARTDVPLPSTSPGRPTPEAAAIAAEWGVTKQWRDLMSALGHADV
jgi:5'-3' exonuclease